ncbi:MAG TPA: tetratricopeptide repeat protein [Nitrospirota bacterium]|nr:tetratricopeptide repeat protein [Nitrospirota bacterium]
MKTSASSALAGQKDHSGDLSGRPFQKSQFSAAIIVAIVAIAVYANSLQGDFVYDDASQILANRWITNVKYLPQIFGSNVWQFSGIKSNYYRPLMHAVFMFDYYLFGMRPWGFHLVNVLFNAGVSVLVFLNAAILLRGMRSRAPALPGWFFPFSAALLFAVHPVHTEAVAWVAGLPELAFTFFSLLSFYLYLRARDTAHSMALSVASAVSYACAILFKETAIVLPVIILLHDILFRDPARRISAAKYVLYAATTAVYVAVRISALGGFTPVHRYTALSLFEHVINVPPLFAEYLEKLVLPVNLNAYHVFHPVTSLLDGRALLGLAVMACFGFLAFILLKKDRSAFFSLALIVLPLMPVLYVAGVGENTFAERYLYLPSFGFSLLFAAGLARIVRPALLPTLSAVLAVLFVLLCAATVQRNGDWKNDVLLWTDTVKKSPESTVPLTALGYALLNDKSPDKAIACFEEVLKRKPDFYEARLNIGIAFAGQGRYREAVGQLEAAAALKPEDVQAHEQLALLYRKAGLRDKAIEQYRTIAALQPGSVSASHELAVVYAEMGMTDQAIAQFQDALRLEPDNSTIHYNLAIAYENSGMIDQAIEQFQIALQLNPGDAEVNARLERAREVKASGRVFSGAHGLRTGQ